MPIENLELRSEFFREVRSSSDTLALLVAEAEGFAARLRGVTPVDTGQTVAGTHVETGRSPDGSVYAVVVQPGHGALAEQFGNSIERTPARQFDLARGL